MNEIRKLMETIEQINEGWDPKAVAEAIWLEYSGPPGSDQKTLFRLKIDQSPEPYRAMIYNFGSLTGLYNAETLDGSEIYHAIVDELERLDTLKEDSEYGEPGDEQYIRQYGSVKAEFDEVGGEVLLTHGHGENIFLTMKEWKEFAGEIQDIFV